MAKPIHDSPGTLQYCSVVLLARIEVAVLMWLKFGAKGDALAHGVHTQTEEEEEGFHKL